MFVSRRNRRNNRGTSLIEMVTGAIFFIPIALVAVDLVSLSMVEQVNDHIARDAARAAANQLDSASATAAAQKTVKMFKVNALIADVHLDKCTYNDGAVQLQTTIDAKVPAPFFGFSGKKMIAQSFQPIVGQPADL
jgi:Flp pilus assembly protein TadG